MMLEIALEADAEWDSSRSWEDLARQAAEAAVAESAFPQLMAIERPVEISIRLTDNHGVQLLNAEWRGKDKATNVLSFPMVEKYDLSIADVAGQQLLLGDIVLAHGICEAEAADRHLSLEEHASHLLVHGTLHLLGYDHLDDDEAAEMEAVEIRALERLGIANPYEVSA